MHLSVQSSTHFGPKWPVPAGMRVRLHSLRGGWSRKVTSIMEDSDHTTAHVSSSSTNVPGGADLAFSAFVFEHTGCWLIESRLGEDLLACWCPQCDETQTFGTMPRTKAG
jgi:hypothetical protein